MKVKLSLLVLVILIAVGVNISQSEMFAKNPLPLNLTNFNAGKSLYDTNCASCHGADGKGKGEEAKRLAEIPADLTQAPEFPQGFIEFVIKNGGDTEVMQGWEGKLTQQEIYLIANYVRVL